MRIDSIWAVVAVALAPVVLVIVFMLLLTTTREELFDRCLGMAERAGLLEEAALVCLDNATRRGLRSGNAPLIVVPTTGGQWILQ